MTVKPESMTETKTAFTKASTCAFCTRRIGGNIAERVNASSAVIIIARTPDDTLLFVEQFRDTDRQAAVPSKCRPGWSAIWMPTDTLGTGRQTRIA